jgi:hypothetical protein
MYPKILKLLVISAFTLFACQKGDGFSPSGRSASLVKLVTTEITGVAVRSALLETMPEADIYAGYKPIICQRPHAKRKRGDFSGSQVVVYYLRSETLTRCLIAITVDNLFKLITNREKRIN